MPGALEGGFIYVQFTALSGVSSFVSIKNNFDAPDITCSV